MTDPISEAIEFIESKKFYPMHHNRLPDYMIEENKKIDDIVQSLRAMQETSVEELKINDGQWGGDASVATSNQIYEDGWNDCIDHLHTTGRLRTALPEIDCNKIEHHLQWIEHVLDGQEDIKDNGCPNEAMSVMQEVKAIRELIFHQLQGDK